MFNARREKKSAEEENRERNNNKRSYFYIFRVQVVFFQKLIETHWFSR